MSDVTLQLVCSALVLLVPLALTLVLAAGRETWIVAGVAGAIGVGVSSTSELMTAGPADIGSSVLDASGAGAFAASVAVLVAVKNSARASIVIATVWVVFIYQPVFWATVTSVPPLTQTVFGAVDFAAVLVTHVSVAAMVATLSWLPSVSSTREAALREVSWGRATLATVVLVVGATAWMLGLERVLSESSGRIALNTLAGLVLGAVVWLVIAQIAGRRSGPHGLLWGALAAWGAIGGGVAFLAPTALTASVVIGVAAAAAVVVRAKQGAHEARRFAVATVVAVAAGGVVLAILADGFGMAATGSLSLVAAQLGALTAVAAFAAAITVVYWVAARIIVVAREKTRSRAVAEQAVAE